MSEGGPHIFWCKKCRRVITTEPATEHQAHKEQIVGIRQDLFLDGIARMVWELGVQGRLLLANPGK